MRGAVMSEGRRLTTTEVPTSESSQMGASKFNWPVDVLAKYWVSGEGAWFPIVSTQLRTTGSFLVSLVRVNNT